MRRLCCAACDSFRRRGVGAALWVKQTLLYFFLNVLCFEFAAYMYCIFSCFSQLMSTILHFGKCRNLIALCMT